MNYDIRHPQPSEYSQVVKLLETVDDDIYVPLFAQITDLEQFSKTLFTAVGSPFSQDSVWVLCDNNQVCAVIVAYMQPLYETFAYTDLCDFLMDSHEFTEVCDLYLIPMLAEVFDEATYVACLATDSGFRSRGYAQRLLQFIMDKTYPKPVILDVVANNVKAVNLYKKLGFEVIDAFDGFSLTDTKPDVLRMRYKRNIN